MKRPARGLACVLVLLCALGCALPVAAQAADLLVARQSGLSAAERTDLRADAGVLHGRMLRLPDSELVRVPAAREAEALAALNADPDVRYAEPVVHYTLAASDDELYGYLWAHENTGQPPRPRGEPGTEDADMDVPEAWEVSRGLGQTVAVVDSGVQETHVDLAANIAPGARSFLSGVPPSGDDTTFGHGTRVAGVIAAVADNGIGVAGVAPEAKVLSLKAFRGGVGSSVAVAEALNYAGDLGIRVVNLSFGGPEDSQAVRDAIARHPTTLFVVASGNGGGDALGDDLDAAGAEYPCSYSLTNVICVGATDVNDERASLSNYGATSVDLFAPGIDVYTTRPYLFTPSYGIEDGTSMAAPMVSAVAALMLSARPNLSTLSLRTLLLRSVDRIQSGVGRSVTGGRANAGTLLTIPVLDADGDGALDELDGCPALHDPSQLDADTDGIGDLCDLTPRGDDVDGDAKALLDDRCPTVFGTEPDGCPRPVIRPPLDGPPGPIPTVTPSPTPVPGAAVVRVGVKLTPKRCPAGRGPCRKTAKVTVTVTRAATVSLRFERRVKRAGRSVWRRYATRSLKLTGSSRSLTLRRLGSGSYRVKVTIAGRGKTKAFRVR